MRPTSGSDQASATSITLLTDAEQNQVLIGWNESDTPFPHDRCVHEILEEQSSRMPDTVAVLFGEESLTHRELNERANALALTLQKHGIVPDARVAILVERSLDMIVGLLAIWKAGGAYVPLDPTYPKERLKGMLHDSGAQVLLTQRYLKVASELDASGFQILHLEEYHGSSKGPPPTPVTAQNLAYVMYTSGSTGQPKGVMVTHRNVVNFFAAMDQQIETDPGVWLAVTSISFDISVLELFWTLARGFKVVIQPSGTGALAPANGRTVPEQIQHHGVTHFQCTPSLMRGLLADPQMLPAVCSLQRLLLGGEALPDALAKQLHELVPSGLFNMYGPTETTVWSSVHRMGGDSETISIGRPVANTQIYILNGLQPVAVGAVGEIVIGGEGVTRGYLNREALTEEKFVPDPFRAGPGRRLYRTGDLGRWLPDGTIQCLGRLDHQVKIRGQRIELGEIESALQTCPGVLDAVVVAREDEGKGQALVAYIVRAPVSHTIAGEVKRRVQGHPNGSNSESNSTDLSPAYARDASHTSDGKPGPVIPLHSGPGGSDARSRLLGQIVNIWVEMLGVDADAIGLDDNFFDLGGHSLLVVQVQVRLDEALGIQVPLAKLFQHTTPSALADYLNGSISAPMDHSRRRGLLKQRDRNPSLQIERATA